MEGNGGERVRAMKKRDRKKLKDINNQHIQLAESST